MKKIALIIVMCVTTYGCSKDEDRVSEISYHHCSMDSSERRAEFILQCIENANPKSDEEPEDWIVKCQDMAEETLCPEMTMLVTERCYGRLDCRWREVSRAPKLNK